MRSSPQRKKRIALLRKVASLMAKDPEKDNKQKRRNVQVYFWNIVGVVEHISLPKLKDAIKKEFKCNDERFVQAQLTLMQTESLIKVQNKVKVWINQPDTSKNKTLT
jgi:hypothetical protein